MKIVFFFINIIYKNFEKWMNPIKNEKNLFEQ